jgi:hypothetical protein
MSTAFYNSLDTVQQAFAQSVLGAYVAAYHGTDHGPVVLSGAGGTGKTHSTTGAIELVEDWLERRYETLKARQRELDQMTEDTARQMVREAPDVQSRAILRDIAIHTVETRRENADDRKDRELLDQAEAFAFAIIEESANVDF